MLLLTLNQPGSGKTINCQGPFSYGLAFTRCKLTSPSFWRMCNRALQFRKSAKNGGAICCTLKEQGPTGNPPTPALYTAQDEKLIGMLPGAAPHCRPRPSGTSPLLGWSVIPVKPVESRNVGMLAP
jgi:hypothetical protein